MSGWVQGWVGGCPPPTPSGPELLKGALAPTPNPPLMPAGPSHVAPMTDCGTGPHLGDTNMEPLRPVPIKHLLVRLAFHPIWPFGA